MHSFNPSPESAAPQPTRAEAGKENLPVFLKQVYNEMLDMQQRSNPNEMMALLIKSRTTEDELMELLAQLKEFQDKSTLKLAGIKLQELIDTLGPTRSA